METPCRDGVQLNAASSTGQRIHYGWSVVAGCLQMNRYLTDYFASQPDGEFKGCFSMKASTAWIAPP